MAMSTVQFNTRLLKLQDKLMYFALSLTSDAEEAKDLLQETSLKALTYKDKFVENTNFKAWLFTIMKNTFINNYRKAVKANTTVDNTKDLFHLNLPQDSGFVSPESEHSFKEINKAIDNLEDEFRIPFKMHTAGYKYKEIADSLDLPIGTVKSRIFFTRKKLTSSLTDYSKNK